MVYLCVCVCVCVCVRVRVRVCVCVCYRNMMSCFLSGRIYKSSLSVLFNLVFIIDYNLGELKFKYLNFSGGS